jgi:hypothetical protein
MHRIGCACRTFRSVESVAYVVWVLRHCSHNGFPVVRGTAGCPDDDAETADFAQGGGRASREGPLEGVILRSQLMVLLTKSVCPPPIPARVLARVSSGVLSILYLRVTVLRIARGAMCGQGCNYQVLHPAGLL